MGLRGLRVAGRDGYRWDLPGKRCADRALGLIMRPRSSHKGSCAARRRKGEESAMQQGRRLGRGLDSLIGGGASRDTSPELATQRERDAGGEALRASGGTSTFAVASITPGVNQPRVDFSEAAHRELVASIQKRGLLQPVILRRGKGRDRFELVAGERRWRAAKEAGLERIPGVLVEASDPEALEIALIENVQREDLNPIERARSCQRLAEMGGLTHGEVAKRIGKERATVTNLIRLLALPEGVQSMVSRGTLSSGHARALLAVEGDHLRERLAARVEAGRLSVRETEKLCAREAGRRAEGTEAAGSRRPDPREPWVRDLEAQITKKLGVHSRLSFRGKKKGTLTLGFADLGELDRIVKCLGI